MTPVFFFSFSSSLNLGSLHITDKHQSPRFKSVTEPFPGKWGRATHLSSVRKFHDLSFSDIFVLLFTRLAVLGQIGACSFDDVCVAVGCFTSGDPGAELAMPRRSRGTVPESGFPRRALAIFGSGQKGACETLTGRTHRVVFPC